MPKTLLEMKQVSGIDSLENQFKFGHYTPRTVHTPPCKAERERSIGRWTREVVPLPFREGGLLLYKALTDLVPPLNTSLFPVEQTE